MGDVTRVLSGLEDFEAAGAVETVAGGLEASATPTPRTPTARPVPLRMTH